LATITKQLQINENIFARRQVSQLDQLEIIDPSERATMEKYTLSTFKPLLGLGYLRGKTPMHQMRTDSTLHCLSES
jgi:hypothetical protein